ncbi:MULTISPECIES: MFS transporter [Sphingobacterium]|jgi:ACS family D-galactonate transporter-like MFS transporter|uniref:MFS transporter n=1 Tax=Sphingobacterium TaxID=28453 RepID=UPI0010CE53BA|nr:MULTISPECIES: MFS transporter [Sphingobacterium]MBB2954606.1 MFS family permease [Sphingobacterium sp. JUb56]MCS3556643.1 MFS family permease [Sphingobacterium sp. JUb21]MCW2261744.1 MFS family permease [Sphingobacterium kitahiroshimense]TCQ99465.1 sugar phosphate permease [Sphingobacterium sp. JUb20]TCR10054.1 sugar phosphate permease [Sphingobacterium sp. JUb78]
MIQNKKYYPWIVVGLLWVVALLNYMDRQILSTMRPTMQVDITELQSATVFGQLMAIFLWIYGLMSPVSGILADRLNRKWLIVGSLFVWSLVTSLMGYATTYPELMILRGIMGVSEAIYIPAGLSLISDFHSDKSRSLAIGIHMTGLYTGQALGGFGATLASSYSWHSTFKIFGLIGVLYAIVLMFFLAEAPVRTKKSEQTEKPINSFKAIGMLLSNISFWVILFYFAIPSLPGWATKNWLPTLFSENLNISMSQAGPLSTITIAISSFLGVIFGGILSDRWIQKNVKGRIYTSAIGLLLTIPAMFLIGYGQHIYHVVGAGLMFGFGFGMFDANNMPILCQFVPSKFRATAYGIMNMLGVMAGAFITKVLGASADEGKLGKDFALLAVIVFVVVIIQLVVLKPKSNASLD